MTEFEAQHGDRAPASGARAHVLQPELVRPLAESGLGPRAIRALTRLGARCLWDAISISREELLATDNCGATTVAKIDAQLRSYGLSIGDARPRGLRTAGRDPFEHEPISTRLRNLLRANSVTSWRAAADLVADELLLQRNVGRGTVAELGRELARRGWTLRATRDARQAEPDPGPDAAPGPEPGSKPARAADVESAASLDDLSQRLRNALRALGARSLADASRFTREQVYQFRGIGVTTLAELEGRLLRAGLQLATPPGARRDHIPAPRRPTAGAAASPRRETPATPTPVLPADGPLDLLAELICADEPGRRRLRFLRDLVGWDGGGTSTLHEIGTAAGLTRERVRQLAAKAIHALGEQPVFVERLREAIAEIERAAPCSVAHATDGLRRGGWLHQSGDAAAVLRLADRLGCPSRLEASALNGFVLLAASAETRAIRAAIDEVRKQVRRWGAAPIRECGTSDANANSPRLVGLLTLLTGFEWLDDEKQWFWLRDVEGNRVVRRLRAIASVAGSCTMDDIANGLARDLRMRERPLPRPVLERLCARMEFWVRDGSRWVCPTPVPRTDLGPDERRVVELIEEAGGAAPTLALEAAAAERGIGTPSLWRNLSFSPVLTHPATGIYAVVGADFDQAALERDRERAAASTVRVRRAQGWGVTRDGRRWLALLLSSGACRRGIIGLPARLGLEAGQWPVFLADGSAVGQMRANGPSAWGLGKALDRLDAAAEDLLILVWNAEADAVTARVRDPSLLHRLRQESMRSRP